MRGTSGRSQLRALARLKGLQTSYFNVLGQRVEAGDEALVSLLGALGFDATSHDACKEALVASSRTHWERVIDPVVVAWDGLMPRFEVRARANESCTPRVEIETEDAGSRDFHPWDIHIDNDPGSRVDGTDYRRMRVNTGERLPWGYHTLRVTLGERIDEAVIISAPRRCFEEDGQHEWGLFTPVYALRGSPDRGAGSYRDLADLAGWTATLGGAFVGTLPLLPMDFDGPSPSPYLPLTRQFWSDFYIDLDSIPFLNDCRPAREAAEGIGRAPSRAHREAASLVDYERVRLAKSQVLATLWTHISGADDGVVVDALRRYLASNPRVSDFARYRYERETARTGPVKQGRIPEVSFERSSLDTRYYEFVQWLADEQMANASNEEAGLYLDLPVGVHPDGYDTRRHRDSFLTGASCGAAPDSVFTTGQDWGAPPLNPETTRTQGHAYIRACLAHHMQRARILRIDHVMGLHRMFCIPAGHEPRGGTYLRYGAEELYAIISLESHRNRTVVVGEDLGTVPREVPQAMRRHGVNRMFVLYYELDRIAEGEIPRVPAGAMASVNTHDMPTLAATWTGFDICQQARLGIISPEKKDGHVARRLRAKKHLMEFLRMPGERESPELPEMLAAIVAWLGRSRARYVMASLDDLTLETEQPNMPGVSPNHPNWRHRLQQSLQELRNDASVTSVLRALNDARKGTSRRRNALR
ncbi:4-alpha-glucanotransferase [Chloroflexota bacterium]